MRTMIPQIILCTILMLSSAQPAPPAFPPLNQQCEDDAGPRWIDDRENFPAGKFYWSNSHARAVLNQDGTCPPPVEAACQSRANPLQAFVEGPISCPDAWFCRIYPDPKHGAQTNFLGDKNFGNCDKPSGLWQDTNTDQDGHCHGGLDPSSYYWWVRDHWNRPYAGRVKCCCVDSMTTANGGKTMDLRGIANRCDYRAKVTVGADNCRDANEDHAGGRMGSGFLYGFDGVAEGGCPSNCANRDDPNCRVSYTKEPANDMCWEILNFGLPDDNDNDDTIYPSSVGPCSGAGSATGGSCTGTGVFSGPNAPKYVRPDGAGPVQTMQPGGTQRPESTRAPVQTQAPVTTAVETDAPVTTAAETVAPTSVETDAPETTQVETDEPETTQTETDVPETTQAETNSPDTTQDSPFFYESENGSCATGSYLTDAEMCRIAGGALGYYSFRRSFRNPARTRGCYVKNGKLFFNFDSTFIDSSRSQRRAICCSTSDCSTYFEDDEEENGGEEEEEQDPENLQFVKSQTGACSNGNSYITDEATCAQAAEFFGKRLQRVFTNVRRIRGCYKRNNSFYFNEATTLTDSRGTSPRKSICIRSSSRRNLKVGAQNRLLKF